MIFSKKNTWNLLLIKSWELIFNKGYQEFGPVDSVTTSKMKGFNYKKDSIDSFLADKLEELKILDATGKIFYFEFLL